MEEDLRSNCYLLIVLVPLLEEFTESVSAQTCFISLSLLVVKPDYGLRKVCWKKLGHLKNDSSIM